ncbi:MAG TPA: SgcJ/EcaC family oxidoreductase [Candidatus Acidoferrales bacterium]|nr:SgcJ/EcaC family oxidoreductase [Candidatus Acidoferrales bacterium]
MGIRCEETKSSKLALWCCIALVLLASSCGEKTPPDTRAADESAIRNLDAQWSKAAAAKDVDATVSYYSDDASLLGPNAPIASDKQGIRAAWASLLGTDTSLTWQASKVEVSRSGDLAYVQGVYQMTSKDARGKPTSDTGKFVEVWKKQADGKWKTVADIFNSDMPVVQAPAPPAASKTTSRHPRAKKKRHRKARSSETE